MTTTFMQALCCTCGNLRTCRRPRNHRQENYWLRGPVDRNWHRETGDLKCSECGRVTRHALIMPAGDSFRDHAERITRVALGSTTDPIASHEELRRHVRDAYRQGRQPNPYLKHLWSVSDEEEARKAGRTHIRTRCGEQHPLPKRSKTYGGNRPLEPDPVRWDQEYEGPDGQWWIEVDCPDCYRVSNERRLAQRRQQLNDWLAWALGRPDRVPDGQVDSLLAAFEAVGEAWKKAGAR